MFQDKTGEHFRIMRLGDYRDMQGIFLWTFVAYWKLEIMPQMLTDLQTHI